MSRRLGNACSYCHKPFTGGSSGLRTHLKHSTRCAAAHRVARERTRLARTVPMDPGIVQVDIGHAEEFPDLMPEPPIQLEGLVNTTAVVHGRDDDSQGQGDERAPKRAHVDPSNEHSDPTYSEAYPTPPKVYGHKQTRWERMRDRRLAGHEGKWGGFVDQDEWELARWLMKSGISHTEMDKYLKLPITRNRTQPSFKNKRKFFKMIDALPTSNIPDFSCELINITGTVRDPDNQPLTEVVELWKRDPVECVREILSNPALASAIRYSPVKVFTDDTREAQIYNEAWTADWWWNTQQNLPEGATIAPVILMSDKTQLSQFGGDKQAYPVYLTVGNVAKAVRREGTKRATVLLGYLPVTKLTCFPKADRKVQLYNLFHYAMSKILNPLIEAGRNGVKMTCADGQIRRVYPLLFAYVGDHPEQALISCCLQNRCPKCLVPRKQRGAPPGDPDVCLIPRRPHIIKHALHQHRLGDAGSALADYGLHPVYAPFWAELPHCNIFSSITPDLLHQIHKGVFNEHLVQWCSQLAGEIEIDNRCRAMPDAPGVRHFHKGISTISQWTGTEAKDLESIFVGLLAGSIDDSSILKATRSFVDFIYYASYTSHTTETLGYMHASLEDFHVHKEAFIRHGVRQDFNFPKFHALMHYIPAIQSHGTCDGYNTELPERLHIDLAKAGYRASSKRDYFTQMVKWLRRQESVAAFTQYLYWVMPNYQAADSSNRETIPLAVYLDSGDESTSPPPPSSAMTTAPPVTPIHRIAKHCPFPRTPVSELYEAYGAVDFLPALTVFIRAHVPACRFVPSHIDRFDVFKRFSMSHPPLNGFDTKPIVDTIRATPILPPPKPGKPPIPAHFDTVLVDMEGHANAIGMESITVAQIRVIFKLPANLADYPHTLAYVELFTGTRVLASNSRMYQVRRAFREQRRKAAVIRLDRIRSSCYLTPKFGRTVDLTWTPENVMDKCNEFFVNHYRNMYAFQSLSEPLPTALPSSPQ